MFSWVKTPDDDVAMAAPVVVDWSVEGAPTFRVGGTAKETLEGGLQLGEEDEVVGPFVRGSLLVDLWGGCAVGGVVRGCEVGGGAGDVS